MMKVMMTKVEGDDDDDNDNDGDDDDDGHDNNNDDDLQRELTSGKRRQFKTQLNL